MISGSTRAPWGSGHPAPPPVRPATAPVGQPSQGCGLRVSPMPPETAPETTAEAGEPPAGRMCEEVVALLSILASFGVALALVTAL